MQSTLKQGQRKNRKAQIKMAETMAIMIVFFFLLVFGFSFYAKIQNHYFAKEMDKQLKLKALQITQKASYLPELQCSIQNIQYDNCFDVQKAEIFYKLTHGDDGQTPNVGLIADYYEIFGFSTLYIEEVYPENKTIYVYNQSLDDGDILTSMVPVSLYDGRDNKYSIGVMYIRYSVTN